MAISDEITEHQSFSERTLKYGRNTMMASLPIIVFASLEVVDLAKSKPFNFDINEGSEIWIWVILFVVLFYYSARFVALAMPDFNHWQREYGATKVNLNNQISGATKRIAGLEGQILQQTRIRDEAGTDIHRDQASGNIDKIELEVSTKRQEIQKAMGKITDYIWHRASFWLADVALPGGLSIVAWQQSLWKIWGLYFPDATAALYTGPFL